jgi:hypothetical protein
MAPAVGSGNDSGAISSSGIPAARRAAARTSSCCASLSLNTVTPPSFSPLTLVSTLASLQAYPPRPGDFAVPGLKDSAMHS